MPAMDLQIVFQGGGAKLYALMAVCEVLQKYESDQKIRITRAGGTSAGAIAAAMLGSPNTTIEEFRGRTLEAARTLMSSPRYGIVRSLFRIRNGHAYFAKLDLDAILQKLFSPDGSKTRVSDLRFDTEIYFTHLSSLTPEPAGRS